MASGYFEKHIALVLPNLVGGGAERVNLLLADRFQDYGVQVDVVLLEKKGTLLGHVPDGVNVIDLSASRIRKGFFPLRRYLEASNPDVLLAAMWPLTALSVLAAKAARFEGLVINVEHSSLGWSPLARGRSGVALRASMRWVNCMADEVVGVSGGVISDLHSLGLPEEKGRTIYNPIVLSDTRSFVSDWSNHPWLQVDKHLRILAVGSLKPAKDYYTLLQAVRRLRDKGNCLELLILGTGPLLEELTHKRDSLGLTEVVHFGGFVEDPGPFFRAAGLFVLSSAWEGFGNVIAEAMAAGTPVVSTDCRSGPSEILEQGRYGTLVPVGDHRALADGMERTIYDKHDPNRLRKRAEDFSLEKITNQYMELFFG